MLNARIAEDVDSGDGSGAFRGPHEGLAEGESRLETGFVGVEGVPPKDSRYSILLEGGALITPPPPRWDCIGLIRTRAQDYSSR